MRVLLDTHVLLWWLADSDRLSEEHRAIVASSRNEVFVSSVTMAEVALKSSLGKLDVPADFPDAVDLDELPFTTEHAWTLRELPWHHRDPFDRMLIAQALVEDLIFLTSDERCGAYGVRLR